MIRRLALLSAVLLPVTSVHAAGLDIRLADDAAQFEYLFDSDSQIGIGGADVGAAFFFNEADDVALSFGALVTGASLGSNRAVQLGAGARLYGARLDWDVEQDTIGAVAVGGKISFIFPSRTPMALTGELFYAPEITSFGDNEDLMDLQLRFELEVAPATRFYVGYRILETELEDTDFEYELDDSGHVGVRFSF